jgi:hypothetical protein
VSEKDELLDVSSTVSVLVTTLPDEISPRTA